MLKKFIAKSQSGETEFQIHEMAADQLKIVTSDQKEWVLDVHQAGPHHYSVLQNGHSYDIRFYRDGSKVTAFLNGEVLNFELEDALTAARKARLGMGGGSAGVVGPAKVEAMMPGKIVSVKVKVGDAVIEGQGLVVLEAMKMENELASPKAGQVTEVLVKEGQSVESGAVMVVVE